MSSKTVILAFSGGLDTSFCVPYLKERGLDVVTLFVHTGGVSDETRLAIERRSIELGAAHHVTEDASQELWDSFVVPFVMGGACYQDQYPLLCSDRYVIVSRSVALAERLGAGAIAHGCTAMGNDQMRFDQSLRCLTTLPILAPIREIQGKTSTPRKFEIDYLAERGFAVSSDATRYTINENLLGATISGSEIDEFGTPGDETYRLTQPPEEWNGQTVEATIGFDAGSPISLDGKPIAGPAMLRELNDRFGAVGVGRGIYAGDTVIGLKGRIVFEAPGLVTLLTAHRALDELTLSREQNTLKPLIARKWTDLTYGGLFHDPLRTDLEAFLKSSQQMVTGSVTVRSSGGVCHAVAVDTPNKLAKPGATYAQSADWSAADAEGFIKLSGMSSWLASTRTGAAHAAQQTEAKAGACSAVS